jgi:hypothetical protein
MHDFDKPARWKCPHSWKNQPETETEILVWTPKTPMPMECIIQKCELCGEKRLNLKLEDNKCSQNSQSNTQDCTQSPSA